MKPVIYFHASCADGYGAAFAAWKHFGDEAEYVAMQYGTVNTLDDVDLLGSIEGRRVFILDFSFPREVMDYIFDKAEHTTWLDHHLSAFKMWTPHVPVEADTRCVNTTANSYIVLDNARSGALIAWEHFHSAPAPLLIKHVDDYDRWQFKIDGTKEFNKFLWSNAPWSFEQWDLLAEGDLSTYGNAYDVGAALLRDHNVRVEQSVKHGGRRCTLIGHSGLFVNAPPNVSSDVGHKLAVKSGTYGMTYTINDELKIKCSLRSTGNYDVSAIAKAFGGGGHKNAAGFEMGLDEFVRMLASSTTP